MRPPRLIMTDRCPEIRQYIEIYSHPFVSNTYYHESEINNLRKPVTPSDGLSEM